MVQSPQVNIPAGFGGLTRFKEEYGSQFNLKPAHVVLFVVLVIAFRVALEFIY